MNMKNMFLKILIVVFVVLLTTGISFAAFTSLKPFGGKVISSGEANEILTLESAAFVCVVPGTTFNIKPVGSSLAGPYLIPFGVIGRGGGAPALNKWILGLYDITPTTVTCTQPVTEITEEVTVYSVTLYGTSKQ